MTLLLIVGLAMPFAADGKRIRGSRHLGGGLAAPSYGGSGLPSSQPRGHYGTSGQSVGTVTAPSIGTYNWPSVGVTNAVPTWSNTNSPMR
jgi:hypothetical protein